MMDDLNLIIEFCSKFYIWELVIILVAIGLTQLLKMPIKNCALKYQEKYKIDKSIITQLTIIIPYVLCAIMTFFLFWYKSGWSIYTIEWKAMAAEIGILGSGSIGLYELVKKIIQGSKAIQEKKELANMPPEKVSYRIKERK